MIYRGTVSQATLAIGSPSEQPALCLETNDGNFHLRRQGGAVPIDEVLAGLVGHKVAIEGHLIANTIFVVSWQLQ